MPIAPHLLYPQFMDDCDKDERELGISFALALLEKCSEMWVFGDKINNGMAIEMERTIEIGLPIKRFNSKFEEV
jgi:hypothetical protein